MKLLKKKQNTFKVDPKDIFLDFFESEELRLLEEQEILDEYEEKKRKIDDYFAYLKFYQDDKINDNYLKIEIDNDQKEYKKMMENELKNYYDNKNEEKKNDWANQIERAKWQMPVESYGPNRCIKGHTLSGSIICGKCDKGNLYWVDSYEKYAICDHCNNITKLSGRINCMVCGARTLNRVKWIKGYKP